MKNNMREKHDLEIYFKHISNVTTIIKSQFKSIKYL